MFSRVKSSGVFEKSVNGDILLLRFCLHTVVAHQTTTTIGKVPAYAAIVVVVVLVVVAAIVAALNMCTERPEVIRDYEHNYKLKNLSVIGKKAHVSESDGHVG